MKRLVKSIILAGTVVTALLLVGVTPVLAIPECSTTCSESTPCSTICYDEYTTTCGSGFPCCEDAYPSGSGSCNTRHWKASTQVCKERFYDYTQTTDYCTDPPQTTTSFTLTFAANFSSTEAECPEFSNCPE